MAAITSDGTILQEEDPEKLLQLPATLAGEMSNNLFQTALEENIQQRKQNLLKQINERNLGYFEQEVKKLEDWADDLKLGLEQEIKEIDREIKDVRRTAAVAATLEEKLSWQKKQRELEQKRNKLRRELYERQDNIEAERNRLIDELEAELQQKVTEKELFVIEWEIK